MSQVELLDDLEDMFTPQVPPLPAPVIVDEPVAAEMPPEHKAMWSAIDANQRKQHEDRRYVDRLERRLVRLETTIARLTGVIAANAVEQRDDERRFSERRNHLAPVGSYNDVERRLGQRRRPADVGAEDAL